MAITILGSLPGTAPDTADYPSDVFDLGPYKALVRRITMDSAYPAGGEPLAPSDVGLSKIYLVAILSSNTAALTGVYDVVNEKIKLHPGSVPALSTDAAVVENAFADLSNVEFTVLILGK